MAEDPPTATAQPPRVGETPADERGLLKLPRRIRGLVRFVLTVAAALVLGGAIEKVIEATAEDTQAARAAFVSLERDAVQAVATLEPGTATQLFLADIAMSPKATAAMIHQGEERRAGHKIPQGALLSDDPERYRSMAERETGVRLGHWGSDDRGTSVSPTAPLAALLDVVWHLFTTGKIVARIVILAQLALGATATAALLAWASSRGVAPTGILLATLFPLCTVLLASGSAYATGFVITTSQDLLGAVSRIAGLSVGLGAVGSCCVAFFEKSVELVLHKRLETLVDKV